MKGWSPEIRRSVSAVVKQKGPDELTPWVALGSQEIVYVHGRRVSKGNRSRIQLISQAMGFSPVEPL